MEIDAVLEAEITEPDEGGAGTLGTALSFEILEEGGTFDSEGDVIPVLVFRRGWIVPLRFRGRFPAR